ncbi:MAG: metal ABC transporter permease [Candidatus Eisenbacteria bacterium]|nr:metal ABC transporter permease [Candidatus Eisenbacteria bacterium]
MTGFLQALGEHSFLQYALLAGLLASVSCGIIGTYVVVRRISYIAGGIAHSVLGGIGAALYLQRAHGWTSLDPIVGALVAAMIAALIIGLVSLRARQRVDTVIGAVWAIGMAVGVLFLSRTPGYGEDLMSYLFGNILMVSRGDLWLMAALDGIVVTATLLLFKQLESICFDEEFSRVRGLNVGLNFIFLLLLTALTVVLLVTVVGIVMVIALLTIPAAIAGHFTRRLSHMMILAIVVSMALTTIGLAASYGPDLPTGATIIVLSGATYLVVAAASGRLRRRGAALRRRPRNLPR